MKLPVQSGGSRNPALQREGFPEFNSYFYVQMVAVFDTRESLVVNVCCYNSTCDQYSRDGDNDTSDDLDDNCPLTENPGQEDTYPPQGNGIGDACECEADFDCDGDVNRYDLETFMANYNTSKRNTPASAIDPLKVTLMVM